MRTDSLRLSEEAVEACRAYIAGNYDAPYLPKAPRAYAAPGRSYRAMVPEEDAAGDAPARNR